jgi:hypothetical protein
MKKFIIYILSAVSIGLLISFYYYSMLKEEINVKVISVFQTGVYSNYDEALIASDSKSKIFYDGKLYHIYDSIVSDDDSKTKMINYYKQNNIEYYIKEKYVNTNLYESINKYSELIKISDDDTLKIINRQIVEKFGDEVI